MAKEESLLNIQFTHQSRHTSITGASRKPLREINNYHKLFDQRSQHNVPLAQRP